MTNVVDDPSAARHRLRNEITAEAARRALAAGGRMRAKRLKIYEDAIAELSEQYGLTEASR